MTQSDEPEPDESNPPPDKKGPLPVLPLNYESPGYAGPSEHPNARFGGRVAIGCVGYTVLSILWFTVGRSVMGYWGGGSFQGWVALTIGLLGLTLFLRLRYNIAGYGYGILLTLACVLLLIIGIFGLLYALCGGK